MRKRYAILLAAVLATAAMSAIAIAIAAGPPPRGADMPVSRSAQSKTTTPAQTADHRPVTGKQARPAAEAKQAEPREPDNAAPAIHFAVITVSIDPKGTPLAAYQFELTAGHAFTVVGLGNAENPSFPGPPRYDRTADTDTTDRLIVADYSTTAVGQLIAKPYPVATIHAAFTLLPGTDADDALGQIADTIALTLTAAADTDGNRIDADLTFDLHPPQRPGQE